MHSYLLVALGSALGGVARCALSAAMTHRFGDGFPWGTLLVNVTGCFLIGLADAWMRADGHPALGNAARQFLLMGVLGGYTTFSSFALQTLHLTSHTRWPGAMGNIGLSLVLCLLAVRLGQLCAQACSRVG